jgi:hypothetical protein
VLPHALTRPVLDRSVSGPAPASISKGIATGPEGGMGANGGAVAGAGWGAPEALSGAG